MILIVICCVPSIGWGEPSRNSTPLNILALLPLSGPSAAQGEWARQGIELAREELGSQAGVEIKFEDTLGDSVQAVRCFHSHYISKDKGAVISWGSGVGVALTPLVNRREIIQIGIATASPTYRTAGDFTFRLFPSAEDEGYAIGEFVRNNFKNKKSALFTTTNEYGEALRQAIEAAFKNNKRTLTANETFSPSERDFRTQLLRLRKKEAEVIILAAYPEAGELIIRQARQLNLNVKFVAASAILSETTVSILLGNVVVSVPAWNEQHSFAFRYRKLYPNHGAASLSYSARAYDAVMLLADAAARCGVSSSVCMRDILLQLRNHDGALGEISFDTNGDLSPSGSFIFLSEEQ